MASKLYRSSARVCEDEVSDMETFERRSKIPKMPKKFYRLDGRGRSSKIRKSNSRCQNYAVSMIPRLERKKCYKNSFTPTISKTKLKTTNEKVQREQQQQQQQEEEEEEEEIADEEEEDDKQQDKQSGDGEVDKKPAFECCSLESKINEDLANFKNNVLRIPEFWEDAGQTVTNVLKNAVNIVSKQYPSADVNNFEQEIQNILKATEVVKNKITTKTENIIKDVNKVYTKDDDLEDESTREEMELLVTNVNELKSEYKSKKSSSDMKEINELEKAIKNKKSPKKGHLEHEKKNEETGGSSRLRVTRKKSKLKLDCVGDTRVRGIEKNMIQSCGDVIQSEKRLSTPPTQISGPYDTKIRSVEDKSCQTSFNWLAEFNKEKILAGLNGQILELHQLCQDHISKFKSFNLQIKLRGICNKAQNTSASREIQILNEEKYKLAEKNSKLNFYNRDLETAIKQKEQDLHQKDRLISQQKKLLNVRDELIEMLKNKCKIEEADRV